MLFKGKKGSIQKRPNLQGNHPHVGKSSRCHQRCHQGTCFFFSERNVRFLPRKPWMATETCVYSIAIADTKVIHPKISLLNSLFPGDQKPTHFLSTYLLIFLNTILSFPKRNFNLDCKWIRHYKLLKNLLTSYLDISIPIFVQYQVFIRFWLNIWWQQLRAIEVYHERGFLVQEPGTS